MHFFNYSNSFKFMFSSSSFKIKFIISITYIIKFKIKIKKRKKMIKPIKFIKTFLEIYIFTLEILIKKNNKPRILIYETLEQKNSLNKLNK